jgi:hypothetical protein
MEKFEHHQMLREDIIKLEKVKADFKKEPERKYEHRGAFLNVLDFLIEERKGLLRLLEGKKEKAKAKAKYIS